MPVSWQMGPASSCAMSMLVAMIPSACDACVPATSASSATPMAARTSGGRLVEVSVISSIKLSFRNVISFRVAWLLFAHKVVRVVRITAARVLGMLRIRAQRTAASREGRPRGHYAVRSHTLLHPIHNRAQHVEAIQRRAPTLTVPHAGHEVEPAPGCYRRIDRTAAGV